MTGPYQIFANMTDAQIAQLDPEKLLLRFGPVAVGGRQQEWKEICNRLDRLWKLEHKESKEGA